jgi:hypothetical protein
LKRAVKCFFWLRLFPPFHTLRKGKKKREVKMSCLLPKASRIGEKEKVYLFKLKMEKI